MLSRADVKDNVKLIFGVPFANSRLFNVHLTLETRTESQFCVSVGCDGFLKSVSGRIDSSVLSLFLLRRFFSFALSPSFRLSLPPSGSRLPSFLPSFLPSVVTSSSGDALRTKSLLRRYRAYFMFVRSRKNLHTCKLPLAGSRSPIIKYARSSHIGFAFPLYKPDTFMRASNAQVRCVHYLHIFIIIIIISRW